MSQSKKSSSSKPNQSPGKPESKKHPIKQQSDLHRLAPPYDRLLNLGYGEFPDAYKEIADAAAGKDINIALETLVAIALDTSFMNYMQYDVQSDQKQNPKLWTRLHAVRVLSHLKDDTDNTASALLPLLDDEDDALREEMPFYYAAQGRAVYPLLSNIVLNSAAQEWLRIGAGDTLVEMAEAHPEMRAEIIVVLENALQDNSESDLCVAYLVANLMDLGSVESMPIIDKAYLDDRVDEYIVTLAQLQEHFGLEITDKRKVDKQNVNAKTIKIRALDESNLEESETREIESVGVEDSAISRPFVAPEKIGRNETCPCGSGKKYKKCCGAG